MMLSRYTKPGPFQAGQNHVHHALESCRGGAELERHNSKLEQSIHASEPSIGLRASDAPISVTAASTFSTGSNYPSTVPGVTHLSRPDKFATGTIVIARSEVNRALPDEQNSPTRQSLVSHQLGGGFDYTLGEWYLHLFYGNGDNASHRDALSFLDIKGGFTGAPGDRKLREPRFQTRTHTDSSTESRQEIGAEEKVDSSHFHYRCFPFHPLVPLDTLIETYPRGFIGLPSTATTATLSHSFASNVNALVKESEITEMAAPVLMTASASWSSHFNFNDTRRLRYILGSGRGWPSSYLCCNTIFLQPGAVTALPDGFAGRLDDVVLFAVGQYP